MKNAVQGVRAADPERRSGENARCCRLKVAFFNRPSEDWTRRLVRRPPHHPAPLIGLRPTRLCVIFPHRPQLDHRRITRTYIRGRDRPSSAFVPAKALVHLLRPLATTCSRLSCEQ